MINMKNFVRNFLMQLIVGFLFVSFVSCVVIMDNRYQKYYTAHIIEDYRRSEYYIKAKERGVILSRESILHVELGKYSSKMNRVLKAFINGHKLPDIIEYKISNNIVGNLDKDGYLAYDLGYFMYTDQRGNDIHVSMYKK